MKSDYLAMIIPVANCFFDTEHKFNFRNEPSAEDVDALIGSIEKEGVLQPIIVTPYKDAIGNYIIVDGNHRVMACQRLGIETIPANIIEDEKEAVLVGMTINFQRKDLHCVEKARSLKALEVSLKEDNPDIKNSEIAKRVGLSGGAVTQFIKISELPTEVLDKAVLYKKYDMKKLYRLCPTKKHPYKTEEQIAMFEKSVENIGYDGKRINKTERKVTPDNEKFSNKIASFVTSLGSLKKNLTSEKREAPADEKLLKSIDTVIKYLSKYADKADEGEDKAKNCKE